MRVLILESSGNLWGSERALLDLIDGLPKGDLELAVCCPPNRPLQPELERRGLRIYPRFVYALHERTKAARLRAAWGLLTSCLSFRPDLIYLNQAGAARIASFVAKVLRVPVVAHVRIFEDAAYLASLNPSPSWLRSVIAISEAIAAELRSQSQLATIPIHTLYDAYRLKTILGKSEPRSVKRIACVGRLEPIKGQDLLVEALGILNSQGVEVECTFAGSGNEDFTARLRARATECGIEGKTQFPGYSDSVREILNDAAMLVCPSHREPLGRVLFEAWDSGSLPLVFAGSGGAAEAVRASAGGLIYERQDAACLAEAIRAGLALDPQERAELVEKGRNWIGEHLAPETYGREIARIFREAASGPKTP